MHLAAAETFQSHAKEGELERLQQKFGVRQPYVVIASARNWRTKNLEGALKVLAMARGLGNIDFQTLVYGPPDGLDALGDRELQQKLNVIRAGYLEAEDLAALFRHAHAFVMPSLYEGFGLPLVEAMSCGCPVITSNRGSLPEVAGAGALCFDPLDIPAMASALVELLRSPVELEQRKSAALKRAVDFSWNKAALETMAVYHLLHGEFRREKNG